MNPRARSLADNQVHAKIFHRRVQHFFHRGLQAVNFIQEENLFFFKRGQNRCQVPLALQQGPGAGLYRNVQFVGDDLCQGRFSKTWWSVEQHVVQRLATA